MLQWQPEFQFDQPTNHMQPFPLPDNASYEIRSRLAMGYQRYTLLILNGGRTTEHWHTNTSQEPSAQAS